VNGMRCARYRECRVGMIDRVCRMCRVVKVRIARPARPGLGKGVSRTARLG
jgi:hypothetical protein